MRCPECNASFSELRDVCPTCSNDLREYKTKLKIPISFPELPYTELILKFPKTRNFASLYEPKKDTVSAVVKTPQEEIIDMFTQAYGEINKMRLGEVSLGTAQLGRSVDHKEISLLFEVLDDALFESARYVEEIQTSESKFVESSDLQNEFDKFAQLAEAPLFSLKGAQPGIVPQLAIPSMKSDGGAGYKPRFLGRFSRIVSAGIDGLIIIVLAFGVSFVILHGAARQFFFESLGDMFIAYGDIVSLGAGLLIPCATIYLLLMSFLSRRTIGLYLVGGVFSSDEGRRASIQALVLRSLLAPVTTILSGFIPLFTGNRGWHEKMTGMDIVLISRKRALPSS